MKTFSVVTIVTLSFWSLTLAGSTPDNPCENRPSNVEIGQCYATEQVRVTAEADLLANKVAAQFRKESQDSSSGVEAEELRKAAFAVLQSQKSWKAYRDQHCNAVGLSFTTGSGAGIANSSCMLKLGQQRMQILREDFGSWLH